MSDRKFYDLPYEPYVEGKVRKASWQSVNRRMLIDLTEAEGKQLDCFQGRRVRITVLDEPEGVHPALRGKEEV